MLIEILDTIKIKLILIHNKHVFEAAHSWSRNVIYVTPK